MTPILLILALTVAPPADLRAAGVRAAVTAAIVDATLLH